MSDESVSTAVVPTSAAFDDRWRWTRRLGRLGAVGAVVLGASIALDLGGASWSAELVAWLFGLPFSFPLAWTEALYPSAQGGPAAAWSWVHLALGASTIASWMGLGAVVDFIRRRRRPKPPTELPAAETDRYLAAGQAEVEAFLRGKDRERDGLSRLNVFAFVRRLARAG